MKYLFFFLLLIFVGCSQSTPHYGYSGKYTTSIGVDRAFVKRKLDELQKNWLRRGCECYGLVLLNNNNGSFPGKPVRCKILSIYDDRVKCEALEEVTLIEKGVGYQLGIKKGQIWWEKDADLFKTKDDAVGFLMEKGWLWKN